MDNNNKQTEKQVNNQQVFDELLELGFDRPSIRYAMFILNKRSINELAKRLCTSRMTIYNTIHGRSKNFEYIMGYSNFFNLDPTHAFSDILISNL